MEKALAEAVYRDTSGSLRQAVLSGDVYRMREQGKRSPILVW